MPRLHARSRLLQLGIWACKVGHLLTRHFFLFFSMKKTKKYNNWVKRKESLLLTKSLHVFKQFYYLYSVVKNYQFIQASRSRKVSKIILVKTKLFKISIKNWFITSKTQNCIKHC